ncbi:uncharacterized protein LOC128671940 [Plodia interpunctella]|uniref:uncharacterized protein LOC128671940 n=1 Tax=Plodia interpunctella TaxID=58824 RepID=UPI002367987D|nr:uncharacterized protein LOC128671940 [Plodia interpunctella]
MASSASEMFFECIRVFVTALFVSQFCVAQFLHYNNEQVNPPVPFPACRADNIDCLRRGLRTFFYLMDSGRVGMTPVDPTIVNSVAISLPEEQMSFLLRRANVTGARWTRLADRKFNLEGGKNGVTFNSDLHVTGEIYLTTGARIDPYAAFITMDIDNVETNITYDWRSERGINNEEYLLIGPERIAVRNMRLPTYFIQPNSEDAQQIDVALQSKQSILDHISNEITTAVMHTIVDNFRIFGSNVPVKYYYKYI